MESYLHLSPFGITRSHQQLYNKFLTNIQEFESIAPQLKNIPELIQYFTQHDKRITIACRHPEFLIRGELSLYHHTVRLILYVEQKNEVAYGPTQSIEFSTFSAVSFPLDKDSNQQKLLQIVNKTHQLFPAHPNKSPDFQSWIELCDQIILLPCVDVNLTTILTHIDTSLVQAAPAIDQSFLDSLQHFSLSQLEQQKRRKQSDDNIRLSQFFTKKSTLSNIAL